MPNHEPFPFESILVGLTATRADEHLLSHAQALGAIADRPRFRFAHVLGADESGPAPLPSASEAYQGISSMVRSCFPEQWRRGEVTCHILEGPRIDRLLEFAAREGADLVLTGHRRGRSGRRSMARRLAMNAPCSLWMVPEGATPAISRVLAAVDFSSHSAHAFSAAAGIAAAAGQARCWVLNVYFNQIAVGGSGPSKELRRIGEAELERFLDPLDARGLRVERLVEESYSISEAILAAARRERADLVVMGTRGRSPAAAVLLGSESEQVIREAALPVLIVKPVGERDGLLEVLLSGNLRSDPAPVG